MNFVFSIKIGLLISKLLLLWTYNAPASLSEEPERGNAPSHDWLDANGWEHWTTYVQDPYNNVYKAVLNVAMSDDGRRRLYDIDPIFDVDVDETKKAEWLAQSSTSPLQKQSTTPDTGSQERNKTSLRDSTGAPLNKVQQEFFKDSKIRDDEGNLLRVYHGTNGQFNSDSFYNDANGLGWHSWGVSMGNPMLLSPIFVINNGEHNLFFYDNIVTAWHLAAAGQPTDEIDWLLKYSFSKNYGERTMPFDTYHHHTYFVAECGYAPRWLPGWSGRVALGVDHAKKYYGNCFGAMLSIRRSFKLR